MIRERFVFASWMLNCAAASDMTAPRARALRATRGKAEVALGPVVHDDGHLAAAL
jgi:hypothetical protein